MGDLASLADYVAGRANQFSQGFGNPEIRLPEGADGAFFGLDTNILVYATDLVPGKVGTIAGLFFGLAFGLGGIGSAVLGNLADHTSIEFVFRVCAFLPLIGVVTAFLPNVEK